MRTLTSTLLAAQKKPTYNPALRIVVGNYEFSAGERVISCTHEEHPFGQVSHIVLDNSDKYLTDMDLKGAAEVIGWGLVTSEGAEYCDAAPLNVIGQFFSSSPGRLLCELLAVGDMSMMQEDRASERWDYDEDNPPAQTTIKQIISAILGSTLAPYAALPAYTVVYDSEDDLISTFEPKDSFRIYLNSSRLAAFRRLIDYTHCVGRAEGDGKIHIFVPTTTGEVYDYEYELEDLEGDACHTFLSKADRQQIVIPNYIKVYDENYSGVASDAASIAAYRTVAQYFEMAVLADDAQAADIADALLAKLKRDSQWANGLVPMNVGAEIYDYVKITDSREGSSVVGNITYIKRSYSGGKYQMEFRFGGALSVRQMVNDLETYAGGVGDSGSLYHMDRLAVRDLWAKNITSDQIDLSCITDGGQLDLSEIGVGDLDNIPDGTTWKRTKHTALNAEGLVVMDEIIGTLDDVDDGTVYHRVKESALTAEGLVILDEVEEGDYSLVKATQVSAGEIILSSTLKIGEWYNEGGVRIHAEQGITIQGGHLYMRNDAGDLQCEITAAGKISAADGGVILDKDGITIKGDTLRFYEGATLIGGLFAYTSNVLQLYVSGSRSLNILAGVVGVIADEIDLTGCGHMALPRHYGFPANPGIGDMFLNTEDNIAYCWHHGPQWEPLY